MLLLDIAARPAQIYALVCCSPVLDRLPGMSARCIHARRSDCFRQLRAGPGHPILRRDSWGKVWRGFFHLVISFSNKLYRSRFEPPVSGFSPNQTDENHGENLYHSPLNSQLLLTKILHRYVLETPRFNENRRPWSRDPLASGGGHVRPAGTTFEASTYYKHWSQKKVRFMSAVSWTPGNSPKIHGRVTSNGFQ